jgi:hypothetical protein
MVAPWSVWINNTKIVKNMVQRIYNHVHGPAAIRYWTSKGKLPQDYQEELDWETLGQAMMSLPTPRRWFVTKHLSGMCGIGKFLVRWKEKNTPDYNISIQYTNGRIY